MSSSTKIILRSSIHTFLHNYHTFTSLATLLLLPFSSLTLLSHAAISSSPPLLLFISSRITNLFAAASFPSSPLLITMLSQTLFSYLFTLPFSLSLLILAKISVTKILFSNSPSFSSLLNTHLFASFLILSVNSTVFSVLFILFTVTNNSYPIFYLIGGVIYSIAIANTIVTCNLASVVSAVENCSGYAAVLRACVLVRGRVGTAVSIAICMNLGLAGVEALFRYRVMGADTGRAGVSVAAEGLMIAYLHSVFLVLEIIAGCLFYKRCKLDAETERCYLGEIEPEDKCAAV